MAEEHFLSCVCGSPEHQLIFGYDEEEMWAEVHLNPIVPFPENRVARWLAEHLPVRLTEFVVRIWRGTKYIFGHRCQYGHWDCVILDGYKAKALWDFIEEFLEANVRYWDQQRWADDCRTGGR